MSRQITVEIKGDASSLEKAFGKAASSSSSFGDKIGKASKFAAVGLVAFAVGANRVAGEASSLNESVNAVGVVFGDAAGKVSAFSKIAAQEAGLSMRTFNELVTPVGASLRNVGFSADQAADSSIALAKRAADMASVFNVDVSEALEAIQSGLRGEADPLERFGVGLSDAAVTSHALTKGLAKTRDELTANDKAQARLSLIMQQTNKLAGDFKNTSDGLANTQRINAAEAENQRAKFGQGLLPVMQLYEGILRSLTGFLGEHSTATKIVLAGAVGLATAVVGVSAALKVYAAGQAIATAAQWAFNAALTANPIGLVIVGLAALVAGIVVAWKTSETFRTVVIGAWEAVKSASVAVFNAVAQALGSMREALQAAWTKSEGFRTVVVAAFNAVRDAALTFAGIYLTVVSKFIGGIAAIFEAASRLPGIGDKFKGLAAGVREAQGQVDALRDSINNLKSKTIEVTVIARTFRSYTDVESVRGERAYGGPVTRGGAYLVGERGPELFVPGVSGTIAPNGGVVVGVGASQSQSLPSGDVILQVDGYEIARIVRRELLRTAARNVTVGLR